MIASRTKEYTDDRRQSLSDYASQARSSAREVGEIPVPLDMERKERCRSSLRLYCEEYRADTFCLEWSEDHLKNIEIMERCILQGGQFSLAMPRGSGKTSLCEAACEWATIYGHRRFVVVVGASSTAALDILSNIQTSIECNTKLEEDFPEIVKPIKHLEGIAQRAKGQVQGGERTHIEWSSQSVVLPVVRGSVASGACIAARGLTGAIRGMKMMAYDGTQRRPDLVILDDPQTDQSAKTPSQCAKREKIISQAVLGLAGPGESIAAMMPCTVIEEGDLADRMLDRNQHPEWQGRRTSMLDSLPDADAMQLWEEDYHEVMKSSLRAERGIKDATEFYAKNRAKMDSGAKASWPARHKADELSAIQHAMNLYLSDREGFFSEYQNQPMRDDGGGNLTAQDVARRVNRHDRRVVPSWAQTVTAYIDVQMHCMFYVVTAWGDGLQGAVIDYGSYPDQNRAYWTYSNIKRKLADAANTKDLLGMLYHGLEETTEHVLGKVYTTDEGHEMSVSRCLIDASWGDSSDTVYQFARQSQFRQIITPAHGRGITASSKDLNDSKPKPGEKIGHYWRMPLSNRGRGSVRHVLYDTNYWKTWTKSALMANQGTGGSLSLFGSRPEEHEWFADQVTAEFSVLTQGRGRSVNEWRLRPGRDNHIFDCLVGSAVAASMTGMMPKVWRRRKDTVKNPKRRNIKYGAVKEM